MNARQFPALATALVVAFLGITFWYYQNYTIQITDPAFFAKNFVKRFALMSAWVAAWSWISHVASGRTQVSKYIAITAAAGLVDVTLVILAMPWLFFAMGWPWPHAFSEITRTSLVIALALIQLRMATGQLNQRLVLLWAVAGSIALGLVSLNNWADQNGTESLKELPYEVNIYPAYWIAPAEPSLDRGLDQLWNKAGWGQ